MSRSIFESAASVKRNATLSSRRAFPKSFRRCHLSASEKLIPESMMKSAPSESEENVNFQYIRAGSFMCGLYQSALSCVTAAIHSVSGRRSASNFFAIKSHSDKYFFKPISSSLPLRVSSEKGERSIVDTRLKEFQH